MSRWFVYPSAADGPRYYRQQLPIKHLGNDLADAGIEINFSRNLADAFSANVCMFSRCIGAENLSAIVFLKEAGKVIVWDADDDLTILERWSGAEQHKAKKEVAALVACLGFADVITVSVPHLASALGHTDKTIVLPNMIDLDDNPISECGPKRTSFLYCGTSTHVRDIELFHDLYDVTAPAFPWIFVGIRPEWMRDDSTFIPLPPLQSYPRVCRLVRPLYALAPLEVDTFNLSKSPIKIWETATLGAYVVASNYGPYAGTCAAVVPPGEAFTMDHIIQAGSRRQSCVKAAIENSWQGSERGRQKWLEAFLAIEAMVNG